MRRFDLGMALGYCPDWGVVEAVREFFQNAHDAEVVNSENEMYFDYIPEREVLHIGNVNGLLETNTLLLGVSSKRDNADTIGKHGEGYKVATVVLTRLGKKVKIYNRSAKEVWTAKVIKSRRYKANVVVFDIEKESIFKGVPNKDLVFEIEGITTDEYGAIVDSNLHLQDDLGEVFECKDGRVLVDEKYSGKLYVGGLFVTKSKYCTFGYDFKPSVVSLDRDRGFIDGINLQFLCGKLICQSGSVGLVNRAKDTWDGEYIRIYAGTTSGLDLADYYEKQYKNFLKENGEDAVPVTDTVAFNRLKRNGFNAVMVTEKQYHYLYNASSFSEPTEVADEDSDTELADKLMSWFEDNISTNVGYYDEGYALICEVCDRLKNN